MKKIFCRLVLVFPMALLSPLALADSPPSLQVPDSHSIKSQGKVTLYRIQVQGLEFGQDKESIDAEVFVTLDSTEDMVYTLRLHDDSPPVNTVIAETLREAYITDTPVTIYHQIAPGRKNVKIHMVQFGG